MCLSAREIDALAGIRPHPVNPICSERVSLSLAAEGLVGSCRVRSMRLLGRRDQ